MNKILKFNTRNQNIFFVSDFHAYHDPKWPIPLWELRGYESMEEMNEDIIEKVNARVGENDILWNLGDGFLNANEEMVNAFLDRINCQNIYYLFGNHENPLYRIYKREVQRFIKEEMVASSLPVNGNWDVEIYPLRYKNVVFYGNYQEISVNKKHVILSHFAFRIFRGNQHNFYALSGHSHNSDVTRRADHPNGLTLDVGWDGKNDVYSWDEICEIMSHKTREILDHHTDGVN